MPDDQLIHQLSYKHINICIDYTYKTPRFRTKSRFQRFILLKRYLIQYIVLIKIIQTGGMDELNSSLDVVADWAGGKSTKDCLLIS